MSGVLAVDVGQSGLRARIDDGAVLELHEGMVALTDDTHVSALADRIVSVVPGRSHAGAVGVGITGFVDGSAAPGRLAELLVSRLGSSEVTVAADAVTAYLGTVGSRPGTVAFCGTGIGVLGVSDEGVAQRIDARGYLLGDFGSGFWLGQRGLQAALDAVEGRGEPTALVEASARLSSPADIYQSAMSSRPAPTFLASFARDVLHAAAGGDAVALRILDAGAAEVATSIAAAHRSAGPVALTGGLVRADNYVDAVRRALAQRGIAPSDLIVRPDAALDGARVLAEDPGFRSAFAGLVTVKESA